MYGFFIPWVNTLNHRFVYEYNKARRLEKLTNENGAVYQFAYDEMNRLTAEVGEENMKQAIYLGANTILSQAKEFGLEMEINNEVNYAIQKPLLKNGDSINKDLYFPVNNSDYRHWRENSKRNDPAEIGFGRDMILFSEINIQKIEDLSIVVRINNERNIKK